MTKKVEVLFALMQDGSKVSLNKMLKTLNVKQGSVMCLISALRNDFGAEIETDRDGRKVLSYQLTNADKVKIVSKTKTAKVVKPKVVVAKVKSTVSKKTKTIDLEKDGYPTLDEDISISDVSDLELADLKSQLGL